MKGIVSPIPDVIDNKTETRIIIVHLTHLRLKKFSPGEDSYGFWLSSQRREYYIEERKQVIYTELAQLGRETEAIESLQQLRHSLKDRLTELSNEQWRQLFITLNMQIHVRDSNNLETWASPYWERYNFMSGDKTGIEISFGIPVKAEPVGEIVFKSPYPSTGPARRLSDRHAVENRS